MDVYSLCCEGLSCLCYVGSVLYVQLCVLFILCSLIQLGVELYGDLSFVSDVEVISLMLEMFEMVEVLDVYMDFGYVGIYCGLVCVVGLFGEVEQQLFDVLQCKVVDEVEVLIVDLFVELCGMLCVLVELCGGCDVLEQGCVCLVVVLVDVQVVLNELIEIVDLLVGCFFGLLLYFDFGELCGYYYYIGVVFVVFVFGVGQFIVQGGCYDDIGVDFGCVCLVIGFFIDLKSLVIFGQVWLDQVVLGIWVLVEGVGFWQVV